jgi:hypothetical protein
VKRREFITLLGGAGGVALVAILPRCRLKVGKSFQNAGEQFGGVVPRAASKVRWWAVLRAISPDIMEYLEQRRVA